MPPAQRWAASLIEDGGVTFGDHAEQTAVR